MIQAQRRSPSNDEDMQPLLDESMSKLFNALIETSGHESHYPVIKKYISDIIPIILDHKNHFNALRPNELAKSVGIEFDYDFLESAQTPSYPSGHATQAFYLAHKLSALFPDLKRSFYELADMVAISRIERGVHFPSDISAGKLLANKLAGEVE